MTYSFTGQAEAFTEVHLLGSTQAVPSDELAALPGVRSVVGVSKKFRLLGRPAAAPSSTQLPVGPRESRPAMLPLTTRWGVGFAILVRKSASGARKGLE